MSKIIGIKRADNSDDGFTNLNNNEIKLYLQILSPHNSLTAQACAVEYFRRLLVRDHLPPPPLVDTLIKRLIRCLRVNFANIQRDAAWALTNCACSPHEICDKIIQYGGLEALVECAKTTEGETRDQVFWTLGNIALDCPSCQQQVKNSAALPFMIGVLVAPMFIHSKWQRNLVWALSQIFRGGMQTLPIEIVETALEGLHSMLYLDDGRLKADAIWTVAHIADDNIDGAQIDAVLDTPHLLERLIELLDENDTVRAALRALGNLIAGRDDQTQTVLNAGLLPHLMKLLQVKTPINHTREVTWILSNIAAGPYRQIDLLFETNDIVEILVDAFNSSDYRTRKALFSFHLFPLSSCQLKFREISILIWNTLQEIGWIVTNALTGASLNRSRWLCGSNLLSVVPELLKLHQEQSLIDRTLAAIELLIAKRTNLIFVLENYQIIQSIRQIVRNENNLFSSFIKARARRILIQERNYKAERIPARTYILVR
uniref:Importin subunit alpha n=1 Tax=Elaeophora elaphi TaxID=1147741 RepID=A0A0R3RLL2_9BILA